MSDEKIYCGNGVEKSFPNGGKIIRLNFSPDDVVKFNQAVTNGGWVNLILNERKAPSEKGQTHYLTVDTWKPDTKQAAKSENKVTTVSNDFEEDSNIPFS